MSEIKIDQEKQWEAARYFAISFGEVPNSFSSTIRGLIADDAKSADSYSQGSKFMAGRLLKSASISTPLRLAMQLYFPDKAAALQNPTPESFLSFFKPIEMAALLGVVYAFKKVKRRAPADEWEQFSKTLTRCVDMGGLVGRALPKVGFSLGLLVGAFSGIAQVPFMLQNAKDFKNYRRKLGKTVPFDFNLQLESFGCTHAHVCSMLLPNLGYGVALSQLIAEGLMGELVTPPGPEKEIYRSYIANIWIRSLFSTSQIPDIVHKGGYYPLKADLDRMLQGVEAAQNTQSWLESAKVDELVEESAPDGSST